ncbi:MAG: transporter [Pyrinomonadaceae bacterium]
MKYVKSTVLEAVSIAAILFLVIPGQSAGKLQTGTLGASDVMPAESGSRDVGGDTKKIEKKSKRKEKSILSEDKRRPKQKQAATDDAKELAKQLANPISSLISLPIQINYDHDLGPNRDGSRITMNVQPVIPFSLNEKWNLISRTILPVIHQEGITGADQSQTGIGDVVQSIFFSPKKTTPFIWGAGPVVLIPTATDNLGAKQLGIGPTFVALKQQGGWTYGGLYNHIWGIASGSGRPKVNSDFIQPFLAYGTKSAWTFSLNTESSYDWNAKKWSVPIHLVASKLIRVGTQPISLQAGLRCWATSPDGGPKGCGPRIAIVFLYPIKH